MPNSKIYVHVILSKAKDLLKASLPIKLFLFGFLLCFFAEGIGIIPKPIVFPLFLLFSVLLSLFLLKTKRTLSLANPVIFIGAFLYLMYLFYLSFFSLNIQVSFEFTVFIASLFLVFIFVRNNWEQIEKPFLYGLLGLGIFFCLYSFLLSLSLQANLFFFKPYSGYQYVYAMFGSNHLGEFLVFPLLLSFSFFIQQRKKIFVYLFCFYFIFFIFSYSRAAYIGFFVGFLLLSTSVRKQFSRKWVYAIFALLVSIIFFFSLLSSNLAEILQLNPKSAIETRESYIVHGVKGFMQYPFYGVGLHNFAYASRMFTEIPNGWASSSHNIFVDVLTETGAVSFLFFVLFVIVLLKSIKKNHTNIYAVLLLSWFTMAQLDYIHQMYSYLLLFLLFLTGLLCHSDPPAGGEESPHRHSGSVLSLPKGLTRIFYVVPDLIRDLILVVLFVFLILYITSGLLLQNGNYHLSRTIYPFQKAAYEKELDKKEVLDRYLGFFPGEYTGWKRRAQQYEKEGTMPKALQNYERAFWLDPFADLTMAGKIYNLKLQYPEKGSAKWFADRLFKKLNNDTGEKVLSYDQWLFINTFCQKVYTLHCLYVLE